MNDAAYMTLTPEQKELLMGKSCFIFDIDGTITCGHTPIPEAISFVLRLRECDRRVIFYTNNPNRSHAQAADYLNTLGFQATPEEIFSSADVAYAYLHEHFEGRPLYMVGVPEMIENFKRHGFLVSDGSDEQVDAVLVGFDTTLTYEKASTACRYINRGAVYLATHPDRSVPREWGPVPDCGSICALINAVTDQEPLFLGKPSALGRAPLEKRTGLSTSQMCMVGDRLYTDMAFARATGMTGLLVLTGATGAEEAMAAEERERPDILLSSLSVVEELFDGM